VTIGGLLATVAAVAVGLALLARPRLGLIGLLAFYPFVGLVPRLPLAGLNAETILFALALAVTLMQFGVRVPPLRYSGPVLAFFGVLLMALGIGAVGDREYRVFVLPIWELVKGVKSSSFTMLLFVMNYLWFDEREDRRRLFVAANLALVVTAVLGLYEFHVTEGSEYGERIGTVFGNPNGLGAFLAGFGILPLYLASGSEGLARKLWYYLCYAVAQGALVLTLSRAAWLGTTVAHAVWFLLVNRQMFLLGAVGFTLALTIAFPLMPTLISERLTGTFETRETVFQVAGGVGGTGADRLVYYRTALDMLFASPLWGHGIEGFFLYGPRYGARYGLIINIAPHSMLVQLAADMGLIGLAVFAWVGAVVLRCAWRVRSTQVDPMLGAMLTTSAFAIFAVDLFHNSFLGIHAVSAMFWTLYACSVREIEQSEAEAEDEFAAAEAMPSSLAPVWGSSGALGPRGTASA
jgi:hypothetical protein